jgi:hypothetical protein
LPSDDATIAILTQKLCDIPDWMWLSELTAHRLPRHRSGEWNAIHADRATGGTPGWRQS